MIHSILADKILTIKKEKPLLIGFDGVDTSGKTTFANLVYQELRLRDVDAERISIDNFHNSYEFRMKKGNLSPEGFFEDSFNYNEIIEHVFIPIKERKGEIVKSIYDYRNDKNVEKDKIEIRDTLIILFDGIFLHRESLRKYWDMTIYLDVNFDTVRKRAIERDKEYLGSEEEVLRRYNLRYIPGEQIYINKCSPKEYATIVIDNNNWENPVILKDISFKNDIFRNSY